MENCSLMPRPLPQKAERGSGVLSDISCHMGRGLQHKECHIYILQGLEFSDDLDCCTVWFTNAAIFLGKAENELRVKFFYLQFGSNTITYVMHISVVLVTKTETKMHFSKAWNVLVITTKSKVNAALVH